MWTFAVRASRHFRTWSVDRPPPRRYATRGERKVAGMAVLGMSKVWHRRVAYTAMSLLLAWHTVAMFVGPAPQSDFTNAIQRIWAPYLILFRLENLWGFFAPNVRVYPRFNYVIEDASGKQTTFNPADGLSRFRPAQLWYQDWFVNVIDNPDDYAESIAGDLCRLRAAMHPVKVTLLDVELGDYQPEDRRAGKHVTDSEFDEVTEIGTYECPKE
jgi:hypothetical protein